MLELRSWAFPGVEDFSKGYYSPLFLSENELEQLSSRIFVQACLHDLLLGEARLFVQKLKRLGIRVDLRIYDTVHVVFREDELSDGQLMREDFVRSVANI